jgi:hypothetical protein
MEERLMHIENRTDLLCIQLINTVKNLQPPHHANVKMGPFVTRGRSM